MVTANANTILDAAFTCFQRDSIGKVTMSDIIAESGLARTTVYRHFPAKDDIISQLVLRDIDDLIRRLEEIRVAHSGHALERQVLEELDFAIGEFCRRPILAELFTRDPIRLNRLGLSDDTVIEYAQRASRSTFESIEAAGRLRSGVSLEDFTDWCNRVVMTFVITPHPRQESPADMRTYIKKFIVPSLVTGA